MTISYTGTIALTSTSVKDGVIDPNTGNLCIVESLGPRFYRYDLSTLTLKASGTVSGAPCGITMINSASAVVNNFNTSTIDFVEVVSGYKTTVSASNSAANVAAKSQQIAGDVTNGIAMALGNSNNQMVKIVASTQTATLLTLVNAYSQIFNCVILKSPGRWLIGGQQGRVFEIDSSGNVVDQFLVPLLPITGVNNSSASMSNPIINYLSYDNNMLLVSLNIGGLMLFDYTTKTKLWQSTGTINIQGGVLCASSSGEVLYASGSATGVSNTIKELDFTIDPVQVRDILFTDTTNLIISTGFNPNNNVGFALQSGSEKISVFNVTPRASTTRTFTVQVSGIDQKARLFLLDDTGTQAKKILDTYMQSPATYRIPSGLSAVKEIVMVNDGVTGLFDYSEYST